MLHLALILIFHNWLTLGSLLLCIHLFGIAAACHAILHTRTSQGAIAWAVSLVAMPYLTLIPYLFLGRSKFAGYADARRLRNEMLRHHARHAIPQASEKAIPSGTGHALLADTSTVAFDERALRTMMRLCGMPLVNGNHVRLLVNGTATFEAIFAAIGHAQRYVIVQFFIVRDDALGQRLKAALLACAARGVRVYFLYDSIGSFDLPKSYVAELLAAGVDAHPFFTRRYFVNRFQLNFRNHRKIVVVDGELAYVGGHNVGIEYLGEKPPLAPWRDTHIEVRGPAVASIEFVFTEDWYWATQRLPERGPPSVGVVEVDAHKVPDAPDHDMTCLVMPAGPADRYETCSLFFVEAANAARRRLWIASPYLVLDESVFAALRLAVLRGVDVRVLIPARRDHYVVFEASMLYAWDAVRAGIRIFRYRAGFLHQKVVLIDDTAAAIGTANLDNRSFRLNFEIMVLTVHRGFASQVEAMLRHDFASAFEISQNEYRSAPVWRKITMHVARLFAPVL